MTSEQNRARISELRKLVAEREPELSALKRELEIRYEVDRLTVSLFIQALEKSLDTAELAKKKKRLLALEKELEVV